MYSALTTVVMLGPIGLAVGCSGTPASQSTEVATASTDTTSLTANPADLTGQYGLARGSRVNVESTGTSWPASGGTLNVTKLDNGDLRLTAQAVAGKTADRSWILNLTMTNVGRTVTGTLISEGVTWRVQPHTGVISAVKNGDAVTISTTRAVTVSQRGVRTPGPMTFVLNGQASTS